MKYPIYNQKMSKVTSPQQYSTGFSSRHPVQEGKQVCAGVQELEDIHRDQILEHYLALSAEDLYLRFGFAAGPDNLREYVASLSFDRDYFLGVFEPEGLVAFCHIARSTEDAINVGELGISVLPNHRGSGWGKQLVCAAWNLGHRHNIHVLHIYYQAQNNAMAALVRKFGARISREQSEVIAKIEVIQPKNEVEFTPVTRTDPAEAAQGYRQEVRTQISPRKKRRFLHIQSIPHTVLARVKYLYGAGKYNKKGTNDECTETKRSLLGHLR